MRFSPLSNATTYATFTHCQSLTVAIIRHCHLSFPYSPCVSSHIQFIVTTPNVNRHAIVTYSHCHTHGFVIDNLFIVIWGLIYPAFYPYTKTFRLTIPFYKNNKIMSQSTLCPLGTLTNPKPALLQLLTLYRKCESAPTHPVLQIGKKTYLILGQNAY